MPTLANPHARAAADKYLETKVLSASQSELRLMLLDGAIKFCVQGRDGLAAKNYEQMYNGFTRTRAILVELINTMKPEPDRELYDRLHSLYMFMITHLLESSLEKDAAKADKVLELIRYDRETWALLMQKNAGDQRAAAGGVGAAGEAISFQG